MSCPRRKNFHLKGWDYSLSGGYFITIVTKNRESLFGKVMDGEMVLNELVEIVHEEWVRSAEIQSEIKIDEFVVMPNHFHAIVHIINDLSDNTIVGVSGHTPLLRNEFRSPSRSLEALVRGFKSAVTTRINQIRNTPGISVWQSNYYDHIIGSDKKYEQIAEYIANNPVNWGTEIEHAPDP